MGQFTCWLEPPCADSRDRLAAIQRGRKGSRFIAQDEAKLKLSKKMVAEVMKDIDICMMTTVGSRGRLHSRPMSNNRNVDWGGDTWFFAYADSSQVEEATREPNVNLAYGRPDEIVFVSVTGRAEIVTDTTRKKRAGTTTWSGGSRRAPKTTRWS